MEGDFIYLRGRQAGGRRPDLLIGIHALPRSS
jgi:hypothetical protein